MKRCLLIVIALLLTGAFTHTAHALDTHDNNSTGAKERLVKRLDYAWKKDRARGLKVLLDSGEVDDFTERKILAGWARDHYINTVDRNPRIGLVYAQTLTQMADEYMMTRNDIEYYKTMIIGVNAFLSSQIIAFEDIARCTDKSAGGSYAAQWQSGKTYNAYKVFLARQPLAERASIWKSVKNVVDTRELHRPDREACASGADAMARAQMNKKCTAGVPCDASAFVEFVPDEKWMPLREKVQSMVKGRVEKGKI